MYEHWGKVFYPDGVKNKDQLPYFAKHFDTVEINSTFYRIPPGNGVKGWHDSTPANFLFAVKMNRYLTHHKRLIIDDRSREMLDAFTRALKPLADKTAAVLVQIQPSFAANYERLETFLTYLLKQKFYRGKDICFEARHPSWFKGDELAALLRKHDVGFVIGTYPGSFKPPYPISSPFVYIRFHATAKKPNYTPNDLKKWADYVANLPGSVKRIYIYFNNDFEGWAIKNAEYFKKLLVK